MRRETPGQFEFPLSEPEAAPVASSVDHTLAESAAVPVASIEEVERVVSILARAVHLNAAQICRELGWVVNENNKRKVRAIARAARPGIVSYPNSAGYKLFRNCTADEIRSCRNHWRSVKVDAARTEELFSAALALTFGIYE